MDPFFTEEQLNNMNRENMMEVMRIMQNQVRKKETEHSSPLGMPINTGGSEHLVKSEEFFVYRLKGNQINPFPRTVKDKQPTSG